MVDYTIYVVEQSGDLAFNRGSLFNAGVAEVLKREPDMCCFILHDVDMVPEYQGHVYTCSHSPRHMSWALNTYRFKLLYGKFMGGTVAITRDHFRRVNGFSNRYLNWGGEDDDFAHRVVSNGYPITRWEDRVSRFYTFSHPKEKPNPKNTEILRKSLESLNSEEDGLNSVEYTVLEVKKKPLFTHLLVDVSLHSH
jgi:GT2 family glycosyltransferase